MGRGQIGGAGAASITAGLKARYCPVIVLVVDIIELPWWDGAALLLDLPAKAPYIISNGYPFG